MDHNTFFEQEIILENERVRMVPYTEHFEKDIRSMIFDNELIYKANFQTDLEVDAYFKRLPLQRSLKLTYPFIVIDKKCGAVAGTTRFGHLHAHQKRLEIGWTWYGRDYRGTGVNLACKYELLNYAFETMQFRRVQLCADVDNIRSQKAILKLGAVREGVFRCNSRNRDGESRDDVYFSITYRDWPSLKATVFNEFSKNRRAPHV